MWPEKPESVVTTEWEEACGANYDVDENFTYESDY